MMGENNPEVFGGKARKKFRNIIFSSRIDVDQLDVRFLHFYKRVWSKLHASGKT